MTTFLWEVTLAATRPERPSLRTQTTVRVKATTREQAHEMAIRAAEIDGWLPFETMSAVRRYSVK